MSGRRQAFLIAFKATDPNGLPVRTVAGTFFRQTAPKYLATDLPARADGEGRNHEDGREPPMYGSSSEDASWGEMFRHHLDPDLSPFEIRRRMSTLAITDLPVLDLTDADVRAQLKVTEEDLTANDYAVCQAITAMARRTPGRFGGILQPSAAIHSEQTLVVFQERLDDHVEILEDPIMTPPTRLFDLFQLIIDTLPVPLRGPLRKLAAAIQREWGAV
jgi:RES domain-containing protein